MQRLLLAALVAAAFAAAPRRVAVTGAGGQTGQLAFRRMLARRDEFDPVSPVWKSNFRRPTQSMRYCPRNCGCAMAYR